MKVLKDKWLLLSVCIYIKKPRECTKNTDVTLPTKVCMVKAIVFPGVMSLSEFGPYRRLNTEELMLSNCGVVEDL